MSSLAWTATAVITALAGAAQTGVGADGLAFIGFIGLALVTVLALADLLARG